jgi:hypothetical protein
MPPPSRQPTEPAVSHEALATTEAFAPLQPPLFGPGVRDRYADKWR